MEQRDLLKDEIEQLGRVLGRILSDFLRLKSKDDVKQAIKISSDRFQSEFDLSIEKLISLDQYDLKEYLIRHRFADAHLEILFELLVEIGKNKASENEMELYLKKAIKVLDIADEVSKTMSFERMNNKNKIENMLKHHVYSML